MILVIGSTGLLGAEVVRQCEGPVRAMVRPTTNPERLRVLRAAGAAIVHGDLKEPDSLRAACHGVDAVISTASSTVEAARQSGVATSRSSASSRPMAIPR